MGSGDEADETDAFGSSHYPAAEATPAEFEQFVVDVFRAAEPNVGRVDVQLHEKVEGVDGSYDIDGTVRFQLGGMDFVVLVEAKMHKHPIKRELVQVLNQKVQSTGSHKGVMVSTSHFQSGALEFAKAHGVALVEVTEGRFTYVTRSADEVPVMTREDAARLGLAALVGHCYEAGDRPGSTAITVVSPDFPDYVAELLLGISDQGPDRSTEGGTR